jgi:hypothetical protein
LSFVAGAVVGVCALSSLVGFSTVEALREGGSDLGFEVVVSGRSALEVEGAGEVPDCEFKETSLFIASLVLNILVNRFVIEGFSGAVWAGVGFCGSAGGAALPLGERSSLWGTLIPSWAGTGRDSGEPMDDEAEEAGGDGFAWMSPFVSPREGMAVVMMDAKGRRAVSEALLVMDGGGWSAAEQQSPQRCLAA